MQQPALVITIDGPAGSGKSTVAKRVAEALGIPYLDTGAMYRALTWAALQQGLDLSDGPGLVALFEGSSLEISQDGHVWWEHREITREIRSGAVSRAVSTVAACPEVRQVMVRVQRQRARARGLVTEGRDQGTVVFPDADLKIFLDADLAERARRRARDLAAAGEEVDLEALAAEISRRDTRDSERQAGPLQVPADARRIDSTSMDVEEVTRAVLDEVRRHQERLDIH